MDILNEIRILQKSVEEQPLYCEVWISNQHHAF